LAPPTAAVELVPDDVILYPTQKVAKRLKEKVVA
jgi:hypothetical protein